MSAGIQIVRDVAEPDTEVRQSNIALQVNLFTGAVEPLKLEAPEPSPEREGEEFELDEGISVIKNEALSQVIVSGFGCFLSKKSERMLVKRPDGKVLYQFPMFRLSEVIVNSRGVGLSSDLIEELCQRGIRISFLSGGGRPYAMLTSPMLNAVVSTRRAQLEAVSDARGLEFSKAIVRGKIRNQAALLRYFGKYLKHANPDRYYKIAKAAADLHHYQQAAIRIGGKRIEDVRQPLMGIEGVSGRVYWEAVQEIIQDKVTFGGRVTRGTMDEFNSLLNYGYGILYAQVWGAVLNAGLEPFAGFLHVDRPGKPSLVLDLVEEFRQPVVDRVALAFVNLGTPVQMQNGILIAETKSAFAEKIMARLSTPEPYQGKHFQIRSVIQQQARRLASFLRGDSLRYSTFSFKW
ncbi:MAG: CRISPR-associated endonuclease Cas1 [Terriglobales bacterium]